jgi:hypothetical protein
MSLPKPDPAMRLPLEIIDVICEYLFPSDFRALRLTSMAWKVSAEKKLFAIIALKFNGQSFERLQSISRHPRLCKLVHYIHYDSRRLVNNPQWIQNRVVVSYDQYLSNYWRVANAQRLANGVTSRLELVDALTEFEKFQSMFLAYAASQQSISQDENESKMLCDCVSKLPYLVGIRHSISPARVPLWHLPKFSGPDPVSESILGSLVQEHSSKSQWHFWNLLGAACSSGCVPQLRELQGSEYQLQKWTIAAMPYVEFFKDFVALRSLDLAFSETRTVRYETSNLKLLLTNVPMLQSLRLYFTVITNEYPYIQGYFPLDDIVFRSCHWKRLKSLSLQGFATTESELRNFLLRHTNTLCSLELGNALLCRSEGEKGGNPGSWIGFFHFLNENMALREVNFRQKLSNGVDEAWYSPNTDSDHHRIGCSYRWINDSNPFDCLRYRIERFITLGEPCPFEPLPEDADLTPYFGLPWMFTADMSWEFRARDLPNFNEHDSVSSND